MAALTTAQTVVKAGSLPSPSGRLLVKRMTVALSSQGGATNYVSASAFGLTYIMSSSMAQKSDDAIAYPTCPSYDGTKLFVYNLEDATDGTRGDPVDITATVRITVIGY